MVNQSRGCASKKTPPTGEGVHIHMERALGAQIQNRHHAQFAKAIETAVGDR